MHNTQTFSGLYTYTRAEKTRHKATRRATEAYIKSISILNMSRARVIGPFSSSIVKYHRHFYHITKAYISINIAYMPRQAHTSAYKHRQAKADRDTSRASRASTDKQSKAAKRYERRDSKNIRAV